MPITDQKTQKRLRRQLEHAQIAAKAGGVAISLPDGALTLEGIYSVRHAIATARLATAKGSRERRMLQIAGVCALCADKVAREARPLSPDSHRSPVLPASGPVVDDAGALLDAVDDDE